MFGSLGLPEILVILVLALLIFGPKRLPEVGRTIGKGLAEFRRATTDLKRSVNVELSIDDEERAKTSRRPPVEGVGRTAAEASTTRELPAAPADGVASGDAGTSEADNAAGGPPGTEARGGAARSEGDDAASSDPEPTSDPDAGSPEAEASRAATNG